MSLAMVENAFQTADELASRIAGIRARCHHRPSSYREDAALRDAWNATNAVEAVLDAHPLGPEGWCLTCAPPRVGEIPRQVAVFGCLTRAMVAQAWHIGDA